MDAHLESLILSQDVISQRRMPIDFHLRTHEDSDLESFSFEPTCNFTDVHALNFHSAYFHPYISGPYIKLSEDGRS